MAKINVEEAVAHLHNTFLSRKTRPYDWRMAQLEQLKAMTIEQQSAIATALEADLGKSEFETYLTETSVNLSEIDHAMKHFV